MALAADGWATAQRREAVGGGEASPHGRHAAVIDTITGRITGSTTHDSDDLGHGDGRTLPHWHLHSPGRSRGSQEAHRTLRF